MPDVQSGSARTRRPGEDPGGAAWDVDAAYAEHGRALFAFALASLGDRQAAEDAVQEVFVKAWRGRESYDAGRAGLRTWLFGIARNVVVDAHRARGRRLSLVALDGHDVPRDDDLAEAVSAGVAVRAALVTLPPAQREVLVQVHLRGRAPAEVATELGVPVATVRTRVFYGLRAMRAALEEEGRDRA